MGERIMLRNIPLILVPMLALPLAPAQAQQQKNNTSCKIVELAPGENAPPGVTTSTVTAGNGKVSGSTTGGNSVTVQSGGGSTSSSVTTGSSTNGNQTTTVTSANGDCTVYRHKK
jgi:hypothetical protein